MNEQLTIIQRDDYQKTFMLILNNNQISCFLTLSSVVDVLMRKKGLFYCVSALEIQEGPVFISIWIW